MGTQLKNKNLEGGYDNITPKSWTEDVIDKETNSNLSQILRSMNMMFLSYDGNPETTRLQVPQSFRREGLWVSYVKWDHTVVSEWYNRANIDDTTFRSSSSWMQGNNFLVGQLAVSSEGNWVVNGVDTGVSAKGETGVTPLLRYSNLALQVSYTSGKTWETLVKFENRLFIKGYVSSKSLLPLSPYQGDIYMAGPEYATSDSGHTNPIYTMWVYSNGGWIDNGKFTSISAGVLQTVGNSQTEVMSQNAVTENLSEYNVSKWNTNDTSGDQFVGTDIFSFSQAIEKVPQQFRTSGMKVTFLTNLKILAADGTYSNIQKEMTYMFTDSDTANWSVVTSWESITKVVLTETQYNGLQNKLDNTCYYVIEEE